MIRDAPRCTAAPSAYLKNLYFDTLVYDVETLEFLGTKVGADHLLLGTDFPYVLGTGCASIKSKRSLDWKWKSN